MTNRINYLFYLRSPKKSTVDFLVQSVKTNEVDLPIYFRITVDGQRAEFSTGETSTVDNWIQAKHKVKGNSEKVKTINARLESFLYKAKKACQDLTEKNKPVSALILKIICLVLGKTFTALLNVSKTL